MAEDSTSAERNRLAELIKRQRSGHSLDRSFYTDAVFFERDLEQVIFPFWQFVGHVDRISQRGDYFLFEVADESLIITRDADGQIHALANVCRHRGSRVCLEQQGRAARLVCPYHAWVYSSDGKLVSARMTSADLGSDEMGLRSFPVREFEGLIWVFMGDKPPAIDEVAADAQRFLGDYQLEEAKIAQRIIWQVRANWKLVVENFRECYHCAPAHPEYCAVMKHGLDDRFDPAGMPDDFVEFARRWYQEDRARGEPESQTTRRGVHRHLCGRYPIQPGFETQSRSGKPVAPLLGKRASYDGGIATLSVYPFQYTSVTSDYATLFRFTPRGAVSTDVEVTWLVSRAAQLDTDELDRLTWMWRVTTEQDIRLVEANQQGVSSRYYQPGPYGDSEPDVKQFIAWYLEQLLS